MGESPKPIGDQKVDWLTMSGPGMMKKFGEMGMDPENPTDWYGLIDTLWKMGNEGYVEEGMEDYLAAIDKSREIIDSLPETYAEYMFPFMDAYAFVGEKYLQNMEEFEQYRPKYENLWTQLGNQSKALNDEFNAVRAQYNTQYQQAMAQGPLNINFGGTNLSVPNYKAARELLAPQAGILGQQVDLMNTRNAGQLGVLEGLQGLTTNKQGALQGYQSTLDPRTMIGAGMVDLMARQPQQYMTLADAEKQMWGLPLDFATSIGLGLIGGGGMPQASTPNDWTGLAGSLLAPIAEGLSNKYITP